MATCDSKPLKETTGGAPRVRSGALQRQLHSVPSLQVARAKHQKPALATRRDLKPAQSNAGRRPWRIVNNIITYILSTHSFRREQWLSQKCTHHEVLRIICHAWEAHGQAQYLNNGGYH